MQEFPIHDLSDEQSYWLKRVLRSRPKVGLLDRFTIPEDVQDVLLEKGLVRLWRNGAVEITLVGICQILRQPPGQDEMVVADGANRCGEMQEDSSR